MLSLQGWLYLSFSVVFVIFSLILLYEVRTSRKLLEKIAKVKS